MFCFVASRLNTDEDDAVGGGGEVEAQLRAGGVGFDLASPMIRPSRVATVSR